MCHASLLLRLSRQVVERIPTSADQCVTFHQAFEGIQPQKCHSRAAYVGQADDVSAIEPEVI